MSEVQSTTTPKKYKHFSAIERGRIQAYLEEGLSQNEIARRLGRNKSSISREIGRGTTTQIKSISGYDKEVRVYFAQTGEAVYRRNRQRCRCDWSLKFDPAFFARLIEALKIKPRVHSVASFLATYIKEHPTACVPCFKTVYRYVKDGLLSLRPIDLPRMVRYRLKHRRKGPKANKRVLGRSIEERPLAVNRREEFGHWEIDLVIGKKTANEPVLLTLVERMSRKVLIKKLTDKTSRTVNRALRRIMDREGRRQFKSITADNGPEFSLLSLLETKERRVYFAHPYSSYERGTNEVHNGLIRESIPKGVSLKRYSKAYVQSVQDALNHRPRKIHAYQTPEKIHQELLDQITQTVRYNS